MGKETRREWQLNIPISTDTVWVDLSTTNAEVFADEEMTVPVAGGRTFGLKVFIPKEIKCLQLRKAKGLPAIVEASMNEKIWPKEGTIGLRILMDNRDINMVTEDGTFRKEKYSLLCRDVSWKNWALLLYQREDGSNEAILWWKR